MTETAVIEPRPKPEPQEARAVRALRVLGIIALVEAIIIMTGIIVLGLLTVLGAVALVSNLGGTDTGTGGTDVTAPQEPAPDQSAPAPTVPVLRLGQVATVRAPDSDAQAAKITVSNPRYSAKAPDEFSEAPGEKYFLRVTVLVESSGDQPFSVSSSEFYLRTPDGKRYGEGKALGQSELGSATVNPGERVRGDVVLDVPIRGGACNCRVEVGVAHGEAVVPPRQVYVER